MRREIRSGACRLQGLAFAILLGSGMAAKAGERLPPGASSCSGCHGPATNATASGEAPPSLATMSPDAIVAALAEFRLGQHGGTIMPRLAKGFSEAEAQAIARALGRSETKLP